MAVNLTLRATLTAPVPIFVGESEFAFRKHEIRKSLKTTNYHYAVKQVRRLAVITEHLFRSDTCTLDERRPPKNDYLLLHFIAQ